MAGICLSACVRSPSSSTVEKKVNVGKMAKDAESDAELRSQQEAPPGGFAKLMVCDPSTRPS